MPSPRLGYVKTEGVAYANTDNPRQKLDIYRPAAQAAAPPAWACRWWSFSMVAAGTSSRKDYALSARP
jgi:hypothetical protein